MGLFRVLQRFDQKQREPRRRKSLLARLAANAVGTKIVPIMLCINEPKEISGEFKLLTDDEGVRPLY